MVDISDANFTIQEAEPYYQINNINYIHSPFGVVNLNWKTAAFEQELIDLHYTLDGGLNWILIEDDFSSTYDGDDPFSGSYTWNLPIGPPNEFQVRISDPSDISIGASTNVSTITEYITVTSSAGGVRCSNESISWSAYTTSGVFKVEYTLDGIIWETLDEEYIGNEDGGNSYGWQLPDMLSSHVQYRITDAQDPLKTDESNVGSIIAPPNGVELLSPNGFESFIAGTTQQINYEYASGTSSVSFQWSVNDGQSWGGLNTLTNDFPGGQATFEVPNYPTGSARIKIISNLYNGCDYDISDETFTIVSSVNVLQPNGGESWQATVGSLDHGADITFSDATRVVNSVRVIKNQSSTNFSQTFYPDSPLNKLRIRFDSYWIQNGYSRILVLGTTENFNQATNCCNTVESSGFNAFNNTYTSNRADGSITIYTEGGSQKRFTAYIESVGTDTHEIRWDIIGTSARFNINYSTDNGSTWKDIVKNYPIYGSNANSATPSIGVYNWQVPNTPSETALVKVTDVENGGVVDISDANFTIQEAEPLLLLELLTQNNGEVYYYDKQHEIRWNNPDSFTQVGSLNINLDYSINGGVTWTNIVTDYPNTGSYLWTIPEVNTPQDQSLIRVQETGNLDKFDVSNNYIKLRPRLSIISPNDNESLFQSCTESSITWYGGASNNYNIEISTNNGDDWSLVANRNSNAYFNSYDWSIPNTPSQSCLVKIYERDNPEYYDVSDYVFTIEPSISITSPQENENTGSANIVNISWESNFTSDTYNIDYSNNYGASWISIVEDQQFMSTSYDWDVSTLDETIVYIRVSDFISPCKDDIVTLNLGLIDDIIIDNNNIDENQNLNTLIGEFLVIGSGSGNYNFDFVTGEGDTNNSSFLISNNSLFSNEQFDYEMVQSMSIRVEATDVISNELFEKQFIININDLPDTEYPLGDCNGDFTVSVIDIVNLVEYISGQNPPGFFIENSDVNFDGAINVLDIIGIVDIIMQSGSRFDDQLSDTNLEPLDAFTNWDDNGDFHIESESEIAGLQLEFENDFDYELSSELDGVFDHISYQTNNGNYVLLIYSTDGSFISPGNSVIFESLNLTPQLIELNSLGSNSNMVKINIVHINTSLGLEDTILGNYRVFPNPTSEVVNFDFGNTLVKNANYSILDMYGRVVKKITHQINSNSDIINIDNLSSGVYLINAEINLQSGLIKVINEKIIIE